jgi:RNA polymerase sigma-70 factor (ECF subfamily)
MASPLEKPDFEALFETYGREIHAYLWRLTQNAADAEDCLQETFLKAFKAYGRLQHADNLRAWLYKIATNTANTHFKKNGHRHPEHLEEHQADTSTNVDNQVSARLSLSAVHQAVLARPSKQRAALILNKYQGVSHREIAEVIGTSEDSARANLYQAVKKLREQFPHEAETYG